MKNWNLIDRRRMLQAMACGATGLSVSGWFPAFAGQLASDPQRRRHCILLWMPGGPSQTDTFDMKPEHENGGEFKEIATNVPGIRFSEHLPRLAQHADKLAIIRSLSTKEGDHQRGSYLMRTGAAPMSIIDYPCVASSLAKELSLPSDSLPPYVSIAPSPLTPKDGFGSGFLGPKFAPLVVGAASRSGANLPGAGQGGNDDENQEPTFAELKVNALNAPPGVTQMQSTRRLELWKLLENDFLDGHPTAAPRAHSTVYENALRMIHSDASSAFDLSQEPVAVRESYGAGVFGQGCLLARRLVERGVPFVEVSLGTSVAGNYGWDTHANNFQAVQALSEELDAGWAALMTDLAQRGLLESTTIMWMGEFGRTPQINGQAGRDHFPRAWTCVLGGGGIAGGQVYGRTSVDGMTIEEDPVDVNSVLATLCEAVGVSPYKTNESNTGRPIYLVDGMPINRLLA